MITGKRYYNFEPRHVASIYNIADAVQGVLARSENAEFAAELNMAQSVIHDIDNDSDAFQPDLFQQKWLDTTYCMLAEHDYEALSKEQDPELSAIMFQEYQMARDIIRRLNNTEVSQ